MISIKIVGVHKPRSYDRCDESAAAGFRQMISFMTKGQVVDYAFPVLKKAWLDPYAEEETHRVVLNDDLKLCDNFREICEQIAKAQPNSIVSFFSTYFNSSYCDQEMQKLQTPYVRHDVGIFGCAIMMPKDVAIECMEFTSMNIIRISNLRAGLLLNLPKKEVYPLLRTLPCFGTASWR